MRDFETWLENLEGQQVPDADGNKVAYCDDCVDSIQPGTRVQLQYADTSFHTAPPTDLGSLVTMAMYCDDCHRPTFILPCVGVNEVMTTATIDSEGKLWNFEAVDASSANEGIEWNPRQVMHEVLKVSIERWFQRTHTPLAASDVSGLIFSTGMSPRKIVNQDGSITDNEDLRQEARELFSAKMKNSLESGRAQQVMEKGERQSEWMLEEVGKDELSDDETIVFDADEGQWVEK